MKALLIATIAFTHSFCLLANDGVSGTDKYEADFASKHVQYKITDIDRDWAASMKRKLKHTQEVVFFARTDLPLIKNGKELRGLIYQRVDQPAVFFVPDGNALLDTGKNQVWTFYTSSGDVRWPKSRQFVAFFDIPDGGYPYTEHSRIDLGKVWWLANASYNVFR